MHLLVILVSAILPRSCLCSVFEMHRNAAMELFSGSAAQPADKPADWCAEASLQPANYLIIRPSVALPGGYCEFYKIAFYNIGWGSITRYMDGLATEICEMVRAKCVDAVGIGGHQSHYPCDMLRVVTKLNDGAEQPVWKGRCDGQYIFVWNSDRLVLTIYNYISCGIAEHPWRMAQYLQFQHAESQPGPPLHVCHCHSPSSFRCIELTDDRRERIFEALWAHVMSNDPVEDPGSAVRPVAIFGGDFDCKSLQWLLCLKKAKATQASSVQLCISKPIPSHHSDRAAVFNAFAFQEDSGWTSGSDHDVVLVPLCWRRHPPANAAHAADTERVEATPYRTLGHGPAEPAPRDYSTCRGGPYRYRK